MSDKPPMKRGILSSLMGLFGEDDEEQRNGDSGFEPTSRSRAEATANAAPEVSEPPEAPEAPVVPEVPQAEPSQQEPTSGTMVREAYEPGWYAISSSRQFPGGRDDGAAHEAAPVPVASYDEPGAAPGGVDVAAPYDGYAPFDASAGTAQEHVTEPARESVWGPLPDAPAAPLQDLGAGSTDLQASPWGSEPLLPEAPSVDPGPDPYRTVEIDQEHEDMPVPSGTQGWAGEQPVAEWGAGQPGAADVTEMQVQDEPMAHEPDAEPVYAQVGGPEAGHGLAYQDELAEPGVEQETSEPVAEVGGEPAEASWERSRTAEAAEEHESIDHEHSIEGTDEPAFAETAAEEAPELADHETVEEPMAAEQPEPAEHDPFVAPEPESFEESFDDAPREEPATPDGPALTSRVAAERRAALEMVIARGVREGDVEPVSALLQDPERDVRLLALEALAAHADRVPVGSVRQALRDPSDDVRARAVRLAAHRAGQEVPEVYRLVAERQWPATQQAALSELPRAIESWGIHDTDLATMLEAVGEMESRAVGAERHGFARLARAVGTDRLSAELESDGGRRRGAARLLMEEGSPDSLRSLAGHTGDGDHEVDALARAARDQLGPEPEQTRPEEPTAGEDQARPEGEIAPEDELIAGLARALGDPDEAVRIRARGALGAVDRGRLVDWARRSLDSGDRDRGALGALVVEGATIGELAGDALERGAALPAEARGPYVRALSSLQLDADQLISLTRAVESTHRPEAIRVLWPVAGRNLLPQVRHLLEDSSAAVRVAALEVFGESGDPSTIEVAQSVLERDSSPVVRATAIQVIGRAGTEQRVASLEKALSDPDPDVRATAVEVLPAGMSRQAAQLLLDALGDEDERVWQAAIRHLSSVPDRDRSIVWTAIERCPASRREALLGTLERTSAERLALLALDHLSSPDATDRTLAIALAGRAATPECVRGIVAALQDPAPQVRRTAASALSSLRSSESITGLARALSDPDLEVRVEAVRALSLIDDDNVLDALISALKDPEVRVRDVAGEALVRWRSPAVARRLAIALQSPSLRRPASEALSRMGTSAVDPLVDILMGDEPELAETVGQLLENLVGPEVFVDRLGSMDASDRLRAVEALGAIGGDRGVDGLIRALSDPVEGIRMRAVALLGDLGHERAFEAVKRSFLGDPVPEVVQAAELALRRLQAGVDGGSSS